MEFAKFFFDKKNIIFFLTEPTYAITINCSRPVPLDINVIFVCK